MEMERCVKEVHLGIVARAMVFVAQPTITACLRTAVRLLLGAVRNLADECLILLATRLFWWWT